jgi:WD domain, G-beta repeat
VVALAFSPDGRRIISASIDRIIRIWDANNGSTLGTTIVARNGEWITVTPEGFFSASANGAQMLDVVRGLEVYSIDQFYQSLYRPDLVREKLSGDPQDKMKEAASKLEHRPARPADAKAAERLRSRLSLGCFARVYDKAHLAKHPDQIVTAVKLHIHRPPPGNSNKYWFLAQFRLRGRDETLRTSGICNEKASGLHCFVECDGGGVDVVPRARDAMMYLDRISVGRRQGRPRVSARSGRRCRVRGNEAIGGMI